jgi:hypothetical protein
LRRYHGTMLDVMFFDNQHTRRGSGKIPCQVKNHARPKMQKRKRGNGRAGK